MDHDQAVAVEETARRVKFTVGMSGAAGSTVNAAGEEPVSYGAEKRLVTYELTVAVEFGLSTSSS